MGKPIDLRHILKNKLDLEFKSNNGIRSYCDVFLIMRLRDFYDEYDMFLTLQLRRALYEEIY